MAGAAAFGALTKKFILFAAFPIAIIMGYAHQCIAGNKKAA